MAAEDVHFHAAVTAAESSGLLASLMTEIDERDPRVASSRCQLVQPGRPEESLLAHRKAADAIRAGGGETATLAMAAHIAAVSDTALLHGG
jgi:GntR family transcriptional repressor for pyruvate dehydrogenase complex